MAELGAISSLVGLVDALLKAVQIVREANDDVRDAPKLTRDLVARVIAAEAILERIKTVVDKPGSELTRSTWADLKSSLESLGAELPTALEEIAKNLKQERERREANRVVEILKASCGLGANKQKKATKITVENMEKLVNDLVRIASVYTFESGEHNRENIEKISRAIERLPLPRPEIVRKLEDQAEQCIGNEFLSQFYSEVYDSKIRKFRRPNRAEVVAPPPILVCGRYDVKRSARESGFQIPNSTRIRFVMKPSYGEWFFYVVLYDGILDTVPELFFPRNVQAQENKLTSVRPRFFPDVLIQTDKSLTLDRTKGVPADQDSPQWIFIVVTSDALRPKGAFPVTSNSPRAMQFRAEYRQYPNVSHLRGLKPPMVSSLTFNILKAMQFRA